MLMSYLLGLSYGPKGVAFAYSAIMTLWMVPGILWCIHGTVISFGDIVSTVSRPLFSAIPAVALACVAILLFGEKMSPLVRLIAGNAILFTTYFAVLLFAAGQKSFYVDLLRGMMATASKERDAASAS
jgi:PST family polysaccharide transporter